MGKDGSWGSFLYPAHRYADTVNGLIFEGEQYLLPEDLYEVDTQVRGIRLPEFVRHFTKEKAWKSTKYRDLIRKAAFGMNYVIIGIENQEVIKEKYEEGGRINMCEGLRGWMEDERAQGRAFGIVQMARKYHASDEEIILQLMDSLKIDEEHAKEYLYNYDVA